MRIDMLLKKRFLVHVLMLVCAVGSFAQPNNKTSDWGSYAKEGGVKSMDWIIIFTDKVWGYRADGYEGSYYSFSNIKTPQELAWVFNSNDHHVDDNTFTDLLLYSERRGVYIELAGDIDLQNYYWQGKGTKSRYYFINGNGHTIKNIHLIGSGSTSDNGNYGFFSDAEDIVFYNVNFEFSSVTTAGTSTNFEKSHKEVSDRNGLLIGNCTGCARFYNVNVKLNSDYTSTKSYVGGLAGFVGGRTAVQNTNVELNGKISAASSVGGFVGRTAYIVAENSSVKCGNKGGLETSGNYMGSFTSALSSTAASNFTDCKAENMSLKANSRCGGLIGDLTSTNTTFSNCSFDGAIESNYAVGGMVAVTSNANVTVKNCGVSVREKSGKWPNYFAGIIGNMGADASSCTDKLTVSGFSMGSDATKLTYKSNSSIGGCVAYACSGATINVNGFSLKNIVFEGDSCLGGVVGYSKSANKITVSNSDISNVSIVGKK